MGDESQRPSSPASGEGPDDTRIPIASMSGGQLHCWRCDSVAIEPEVGASGDMILRCRDCGAENRAPA